MYVAYSVCYAWRVCMCSSGNRLNYAVCVSSYGSRVQETNAADRANSNEPLCASSPILNTHARAANAENRIAHAMHLRAAVDDDEVTACRGRATRVNGHMIHANPP